MGKHEIFVTDHAIQRFKERTGAKYSDGKVAKRISGIVGKGKEIAPKKQYKTLLFMRHNCRDVKYFQDDNGMVVVVDWKRVATVFFDTRKWFQCC